jgi:hypothetical protein
MSFRSLLIRVFTFLGGIYFFLKFVLPKSWGVAAYHAQIAEGFALVSAMALALGLINLLMVHGGKVLYRRRGWGPSVALLTGLSLMMVITALDWKETRRVSASVQRVVLLKDFADRILQDQEKGIVPIVAQKTLTAEVRERYLLDALAPLLGSLAEEQRGFSAMVPAEPQTPSEIGRKRFSREFAAALEETSRLSGIMQSRGGGYDPAPLKQLSQALSALSVSYRGVAMAVYGTSLTKHLYDFLFEGLYISLGAAMFSLLGFYISAAAYRAFRVKSMESVLMMTAALFVMLGQIPFGLWISDSLPEIRLWLLQVPSAAAARAIDMGASLAGLVMAFRMWLSIESESFK